MKISDIETRLEKYPWLRRWVLNKYVVTTVLFVFIFLFAGDQCLVRQLKRLRQMRALEEQIDASRAHIATCERELEYLANPDSLERYARETYHFHAPNEDVYVVK